MLKLEISDNKDIPNKLLINGVPLKAKSFYISDGKDKIWIRIYDSEISDQILDVFIDEIPTEINRLKLYYPLNFNEYFEDILLDKNYDKKEFKDIGFTLSWDFEKWKNPYSIEEFALAFSQIASDYVEEGVSWVQDDEVISNGCEIRFDLFDKKQTIRSEVEKNLLILREMTERVYASLVKKLNIDSVVSLFDFPESIQVACEQYLIYFVEFLKNIGINATADIAHQAGKVLFSVTPVSKEIALDQIREALQVYLSLPSGFYNSDFMSMQVGPLEQQLLANIQHLNGQLRLANALAQMQESTINNQNNMIKQQSKLIDGSILQQSLLVKPNSSDKEEMLKGAITLTDFEMKGLKINLPSIYRMLRKKFKK